MAEPMKISASSYDTFTACQRMYFWKHVARLERRKQDGARRFGGVYHAGLEAWWKAGDGGLVPWKDRDEGLVLAMRAIDAKSSDGIDPYERADAEAMMVAYHARYYDLDFEAPPGVGDSVERWFELPLLDPDGHTLRGWTVVGKKDALKTFAGRAKVVEHKTTSSDIDGASDYWTRLRLDTQASIYVDAAQRLGFETDEAIYDVSKKPQLQPKLATPEENRRYTKGKGCKHCGGRAGGKLGVAQGTGKIIIRTKVDGDGLLLPKPLDVEVDCTWCDGTGWTKDDDGVPQAPRLHDNQRDTDETVDEYRRRVTDAIVERPDAFFRMGTVTRSREQIADARADLVMVTGLIASAVELARQAADSPTDPAARRCWARTTSTCTNVYGRSCDYLPICSGVEDPVTSQLYTIRTKRSA